MQTKLRHKRRAAKKRTSFLKAKRFWVGAGVLLAGAAAFYLVVAFPPLQIQEVVVRGNHAVEASRVAALAREHMEASFLGVPTRSPLTVNTRKIAKALSDAFPRFERVAVARALPNGLEIAVAERKKAASWCREETCFALDTEGIIFEQTQESKAFPTLSLPEDKEAVLGRRIVSPDFLSLLLTFAEQVKTFSEGSLSIVRLASISPERVEAETQEGWSIFFNPKESLDWQLTKFQIVLEQQMPPEKRGQLEYVDLRFGDQAYLKYHD